MRISYNEDVDVLYIQLRSEIASSGTGEFPPAPVEVAPWMRIDIGPDGQPVGIEIDAASRHALLDSVLVSNLPLAGITNKAGLKRLGLLTIDDFAKLAGVTPSTLRDHRSAKSKSPLPPAAMHVGKSPLWRLTDAQEWVRTRDARPGRAAAGPAVAAGG